MICGHILLPGFRPNEVLFLDFRPNEVLFLDFRPCEVLFLTSALAKYFVHDLRPSEVLWTDIRPTEVRHSDVRPRDGEPHTTDVYERDDRLEDAPQVPPGRRVVAEVDYNIYPYWIEN